MTPKRSVLSVWLLGVLSTALLLACGGEEETPPPPPPAPVAPTTQQAAPAPQQAEPPVAQRVRPPQTPPTDQDRPSQQLRRKVEMPDDYPADAPVYPGTEPSQVMRGADGRMVVMFGTPDSPDRVMDYLTSELPSSGWQVGAQQELPNGKLLQASKDGRQLSVLLSRVDEGEESEITMIAVSVDS